MFPAQYTFWLWNKLMEVNLKFYHLNTVGHDQMNIYQLFKEDPGPWGYGAAIHMSIVANVNICGQFKFD
jgi:hypothetical protein